MSKFKAIKESNNIKFVSLILYTKTNNNILFLLGKEAPSKHNKTNINKITNFSGYLINDESIEQCVSRILFEKTMNLLIEPMVFEQMVLDNQVPFHIDSKHNKIIFFYKFDYNLFSHVPSAYNKIYRYLTLCTTTDSMNNVVIPTCPIGFLDKSELNFYNLSDIMKSVRTFRNKFLYELILTIESIIKTS